ncbi:hypothetical protein HAX54_009823 [Datura stramonium]|uniref:Uncharacterized protein n=1 Tax=Datura stramonium TaxID=4076 RepID=A0ABS8TFD7_DATST|nr:hypothetical protein [Datura stramonium]
MVGRTRMVREQTFSREPEDILTNVRIRAVWEQTFSSEAECNLSNVPGILGDSKTLRNINSGVWRSDYYPGMPYEVFWTFNQSSFIAMAHYCFFQGII